MIECKDCGHKHYVYMSCGHSHCMLCQSIKREQWMDKLNKRILKVPYIHTTFTLPHQLNGLFRINAKQLYGLLMQSCWRTIKEITAGYTLTPGMTAVLHTFGSDMKYHIHVHALITLGGIDQNGEWQYPPKRNKLASYRVMCSTYKRQMIAGIEALSQRNKISYHLPIEQVLEEARDLRWVVHSTRPTMDTRVIQNYLARYINRTAISPSRLQYLPRQREVHLQYNDYKQQVAGQAAPKAIKVLPPLVAIQQILQHILPPYFNKSRHYGLHQYGSNQRATIPQALINHGATIRTVFEILQHLLGLEPYVCSQCGSPEYEKQSIAADPAYLIPFLQNKAPPEPSVLHSGTKTTPAGYPIVPIQEYS